MQSYFTIDHNSGGNHGHQLKDTLGGLTIGELLGLKYIHTPYEYLEFFKVGYNTPVLEVYNRNKDFHEIEILSGPVWDGIDSYEDFQERFCSIKFQKNKKKLFIFEKALRVHPFQTIPWYNSSLIANNVFDVISKMVSHNFNEAHRIAESKTDPITVAIHINRGVDFDPIKKPKHFENTFAVRYMFPLDYFENVMMQISDFFYNKRVQFNIYTEKYNSEEIVNRFSSRKDTHIYLGPNRKEKNNAAIHKIFLEFIRSDILVTSNSSFSAICCYYRRGKKTIYHPHKHMNYLPEPEFIATTSEGYLNNRILGE